MKNPQSGLRYAFVVFGIIVLAMLVINFNARMTELHRLSAERDQVKEDLREKLETQMAISTQIAYATSEAAVEDWAYAQGHRLLPGDEAVVPVEPETNRPMATPIPQSIEKPVANWQAWWELFFGNRFGSEIGQSSP